jgi:hypothetical protein
MGLSLFAPIPKKEHWPLKIHSFLNVGKVVGYQQGEQALAVFCTWRTGVQDANVEWCLRARADIPRQVVRGERVEDVSQPKPQRGFRADVQVSEVRVA